MAKYPRVFVAVMHLERTQGAFYFVITVTLHVSQNIGGLARSTCMHPICDELEYSHNAPGYVTCEESLLPQFVLIDATRTCWYVTTAAS